MSSESNKKAEAPKAEMNEPGLRNVKTTNAFKIINFELFAKPNKKVMSLGTAVFLAACGYILYIRMTDEYRNVPTYNTMNDDGTITRRVKTSKWD
ncbi:protein of unknown function (DUF4500) [Mactra antiquata]